jgi:hypothetical protein
MTAYSLPPCIYRDASLEAYRIDAKTGKETPVTIHLCAWPDAYPDRLVDAPRWVNRVIGSGLAIDPERDCIDCPAQTTKVRP